ncbi:hypothetical protein D3C76_1717170 [compost metagenome]
MPKPWRISNSFATRLPWLTCTPLGNAVEPEVYCRKAMSSPARSGATQRSAWVLSRVSTHNSGGAPSICDSESRRPSLVSSRRGCASPMIDNRRSW